MGRIGTSITISSSIIAKLWAFFRRLVSYPEICQAFTGFSRHAIYSVDTTYSVAAVCPDFQILYSEFYILIFPFYNLNSIFQLPFSKFCHFFNGNPVDSAGSGVVTPSRHASLCGLPDSTLSRVIARVLETPSDNPIDATVRDSEPQSRGRGSCYRPGRRCQH